MRCLRYRILQGVPRLAERLSSLVKGAALGSCGQQGHGCLLAAVRLKLKQLFASHDPGDDAGMNHPGLGEQGFITFPSGLK